MSTHKLALVGIWELPFFKGSTGTTRKAARRLAARRIGDFPDRQPDQHHNGAAFPRGDFNADNNGGDRPNTPAAGIKTERLETRTST